MTTRLCDWAFISTPAIEATSAIVDDIRSRAEEDADTQVTPDDLMAWEAEHGEMPPGVIVAMNSGWDAHVQSAMFRNLDDDGVMHFPGFHIEASQYLLEKDVKGSTKFRSKFDDDKR